MAYASNEEVRRREALPREWRGLEVTWRRDAVIVYDDPMGAQRLARELMTSAKHSAPRHAGASWRCLSLVRLPEGALG